MSSRGRLFYVLPAILATLAVAAAPCPAAPPPLVVFLGDSLTAGQGVARDEAFPAGVARLLAEGGLPVRVVNAGVSGDTSAGGVRRLDWVLQQKPDLLVVGLGANDGLRALPVEQLDRNLRAIVRRARAAGARVLLLGMVLPPSLGPDYTRAFAAVYPRVAAEENVPLVPFLLDGVGGRPLLNQPDGIHPTADGHAIVARTVAPFVKAALAPTVTSGDAPRSAGPAPSTSAPR